MLVASISGGNPLPGLQRTTFSLHAHTAESKLCVSSSYEATNPTMGAPPSRPHLSLITYQWPQPQVSSYKGKGFNVSFEGCKHSVLAEVQGHRGKQERQRPSSMELTSWSLPAERARFGQDSNSDSKFPFLLVTPCCHPTWLSDHFCSTLGEEQGRLINFIM